MIWCRFFIFTFLLSLYLYLFRVDSTWIFQGHLFKRHSSNKQKKLIVHYCCVLTECIEYDIYIYLSTYLLKYVNTPLEIVDLEPCLEVLELECVGRLGLPQ